MTVCLFLLLLLPMHLAVSCDVFSNTNFNVRQTASTCPLVTQCVFENITSSTNGGAIYFQGTFSSIHFMRQCTFCNCGCTGKGGALFGSSSTPFVIELSCIISCWSNGGHGIYVDSSSNVTLQSSSFFDCCPESRNKEAIGAVYLNRSVLMSFSLPNFTTCRTLFDRSSDGTAIYLGENGPGGSCECGTFFNNSGRCPLNGRDRSNVNWTDCNIVNSFSSMHVVYQRSGNCLLTRCVFINNRLQDGSFAALTGGSSATFTLVNCSSDTTGGSVPSTNVLSNRDLSLCWQFYSPTTEFSHSHRFALTATSFDPTGIFLHSELSVISDQRRTQQFKGSDRPISVTATFPLSSQLRGSSGAHRASPYPSVSGLFRALSAVLDVSSHFVSTEFGESVKVRLSGCPPVSHCLSRSDSFGATSAVKSPTAVLPTTHSGTALPPSPPRSDDSADVRLSGLPLLIVLPVVGGLLLMRFLNSRLHSTKAL
jgi:predicted outer membrane repeat protein